MSTILGHVSVPITADLGPFTAGLAQARATAQGFEGQATRAMAGVTAATAGATKSTAGLTAGMTVAMRGASDNLRKIGQAAAAIDGPLGGVASRFRSLGSLIRETGLGTVALTLGVGAAVLAIRRFGVEYASAWTRVTRSLEAGQRVFGITLANASRLNDLANEARVDLDAYAKLYVRTAAAIRDYGYSSATAEQVTSTLAKALKLGGAAASEQTSVILQFSQALQKGKLDGDEFRSVMENAGVVQELLARRLGVTKGEIVKMAAAGKLQLVDLVGAMTDGAQEVDRIFKEMPTTIDEATSVLVNNMKEFVGTLDQDAGATQALARGITGLANNLDVVAGVAGGIATLAMLKFAQAMVGSVLPALEAMTLALAANPLGLLAVAMATAIGLMITFRDETIEIGDTTIRVGGLLSAIWTSVKEAVRILVLELTGLVTVTWKIITLDFPGAMEAGRKSAIGVATAVERIRDAWTEVTKAPKADPFSFGQNIGPYIPNEKRAKDAPVGDVEKYDKRAAAIKRQVDNMKIEAETYGMTAAAAERYRIIKELENAANEAGVVLGAKQIAQNKELAEAAASAAAKLDGLRVLDDIRTPAEALNKEMQRLDELLQRGALSWNQYQLAASKAAEDAGLAWHQTASTIIGSVQAVAQASGESNKTMAKVSQIAGIAQAIINTHVGITKALAAAPPPINFALAAAVAAQGFASVAAIRSQAATTPSVSAPSVPSAAAPPADFSSDDGGSQRPQGQGVTIIVQGDKFDRSHFEMLARELADLHSDGGPISIVQG